MRTIKFRGKRFDNEEWVYGDLLHDRGLGGDVISEVVWIRASNSRSYLALHESVGQWTGRTDKNEVELYEGDVAKIFVYYYDYDGSKYYMEEECRFGRVTFQDGVYYLGTTPLMQFSTDEYEVIHDNPELMEV